jgi:putative endonuclease|tara:strand:+ start:1340 stop:1591 length:252 start_codon:yes stop_codon:yes gene_type:complete
MTFFVYLIGTRKKIKLTTYVGYTNNIKKRLHLHNSGKGAKFTRGRKWKLLYLEKLKTKSEAIKRECYIKKNRKLRNIIKNKNT